MMKKITAKLHSQAGESLGETMISLLIAALALAMVAGAITASNDVIGRGRDKLDTYYKANDEEVAGMPAGGGEYQSADITITDAAVQVGNMKPEIEVPSFDVTYYRNTELGNQTIVSYKTT